MRLGNLGWPAGSECGKGRQDAEPAALQAEGADYARALLDRIGAGTSNPDDLAGLMQFLHSGAVLHGFAAVIFDALRRAARREPKP